MNQADITAGLQQFPSLTDAGVMVHSSLRSFGQVEGGALSVIQALMEVITPSGMLMMPTFNHGFAFEEGAPGYYHPGETPTINGAIPDLFWRLPGVSRSLDPTHPIAAWGKHSREYTQHHHRTLTMGLQSPLGRLYQAGGYVLLLGVGYGSNTFHHVVETALRAPCLGLRSEAYPVRLPDGRTVPGRTWGWRDSACPFTDQSLYPPEMESRHLHQTAWIGECRAIMFRMQDCFNVVAELLLQGRNGIPGCRGCPIRPRRVPQAVESDWDVQRETLKADSTAWDY
jgi:aminoglycoside 3-N-acetyltransferase